MNATIEIVCYKSKTLKDSTHPLMLRISKDGKKKYVSLGIGVNQRDWDFKKQQPKSSCSNKEYISQLILNKKGQYQRKIIELTSLGKEYTPQSLVDLIERASVSENLKDFYEGQIELLYESGRVGNAKVYGYSLRSLEKFTGGKTAIPLQDITPQWLKRYEEWLKTNKCGENTISQLFRTLRSIYNKAIEADYVPKEGYPFDKYKVSKFNTETSKRAITKADINKIRSLDLSSKDCYTIFSRDIFLFSYFGAGINFADIALLRPSNIKEGRIYYMRKKTGKQVNFMLCDETKAILAKYMLISKDNYLFPILDVNKHKTPVQINNRIHKVIGHINYRLKAIGKMVGVDNLTTYVARHSYATVLKRSGVSTALISESLGHSSEKVTPIYLDSFENSQIDEAMKHLL